MFLCCVIYFIIPIYYHSVSRKESFRFLYFCSFHYRKGT
nr:MAG TPA: hypothetical protein [Caudoviricetes sp.]